MLKKISYETKRLADINALYSALLNFKFKTGLYSKYKISDCLAVLYEQGLTTYKDLKIISLYRYGTDKTGENLIQQKYVEILTIFSTFVYFWYFWIKNDKYDDSLRTEIIQILARYKKRLLWLFPEFKLNPLLEPDFSKTFLFDYLPDYILTSTKPAYDNLKNVPKEKAEPIALLLNPNLKTSIEITGAITTVCNQIDKISQNQLVHLSKDDQNIFIHSQKYLKLLANKANIRHKNESVITEIAIKELSILFGTVAALLQKLLIQSS